MPLVSTACKAWKRILFMKLNFIVVLLKIKIIVYYKDAF
ncbi:hypothetical protein MuYL_3179 [Mucilaginibacter xinganensis]|uniref:Uncharacterized protein n=1 Tax=Mucilaginibacter xinganensis TaxID=1234841 RepID=A0A223NZD8_9SPHI|nr:hypothetical protein MuYL_3179 [Mucilaginibacter xinganensis]